MPKSMTPEERAAYQREYRARKKNEPSDEPMRETQSRAWPKDQKGRDQSLPTVSGYDCGCREGNLCISHAIQRMPQKNIDAILDRINRAGRGT